MAATIPEMGELRQTSETIPARFAAVAAQHPQKTAITANDAGWTYQELDDFSTRAAAAIQEQGGPGTEPIALLFQHGAAEIGSILGVLKAGRMYVALDPAQNAERLAAVLADSTARLLIHDESTETTAKQVASGGLKTLSITRIADAASQASQFAEISSESGAWLMYTSGSTGTPKGVWQSQRGLVQEADAYRELIHLTSTDRVALLAACGLSASGATLFGALLSGSTLCLYSVRAHGAARLAEWLQRERVTVYHSVPTLFREMTRQFEGAKITDTMRLVRLGGEAVWPSDAATCQRVFGGNCQFMQSLSSTETGLITSLVVNGSVSSSEHSLPAGRPVPGVEVRLLDERGQTVANGGEGRICIRSQRIRRGYWRRPEETAKNFELDPTDPSFRLFFSEDIARYLPDGNLELVGRADQVVKIHGLRADLSEIEAALQATGEFEEAAVTVSNGTPNESRLVAYIVPKGGRQLSNAECRQVLRSRVLPHMIPSEFVTLPELPRNAAGKIDRRALPAPPSKSPSAPKEKLRDTVERKLGEIWQATLGVKSVGLKDDFFDLGGDSLKSVETLLRVEEAFGLQLPPETLIEHGTIEALAALVAGATVVGPASPLVKLADSKTGRPLFLFHGGHGNASTFTQLARRLPGRPIYAFQSPALSGQSWPLMSIRSMAARYSEEVLKLDPTGPYLLAGTCMGGLIAFEMARQFTRKGRTVGFTGLIGTAAPPYSGTRSPAHQIIGDPIRDSLRILRWGLLRSLGGRIKPSQLPAYRHFVGSMNSRARRCYRPESYSGAIVQFTSTDKKGLVEDRRLMMGKFAGQTRNFVIDGPRERMLLPPAVEALSEHLRQCLEEAEGGLRSKRS